MGQDLIEWSSSDLFWCKTVHREGKWGGVNASQELDDEERDSEVKGVFGFREARSGKDGWMVGLGGRLGLTATMIPT